jgi:hypothetical protein
MVMGLGFLGFAIWNKQQFNKNKSNLGEYSKGGFGPSFNASSRSMMRKRR